LINFGGGRERKKRWKGGESKQGFEGGGGKRKKLFERPTKTRGSV